MEEVVVVASSKSKKELIEQEEQIPRSLSTYESLLPAPNQEPAGSEPMYQAVTGHAVFLDIPSLTVVQRISAMNYIMYGVENDPKSTKHTWAIPGQVQRESLLRLKPGDWLNDELINYSLKNLSTIFCGDLSEYSSFIFPTQFLTRFWQEGHSTHDGVFDFDVATRMTTKLVKNRNLMLFDHIIFLANPFLRHWNFVVIFPKLKKIEAVDSLPGWYDPKVLTAAWYWMVHYCSCNEIPFSVDGWRLLHSRRAFMNQKDSHNCGPWTVLHVVSIHHRYDLSNVDQKACNQFQMQLLKHLHEYQPDHPRRLCDDWDKKYPLTRNKDPMVIAVLPSVPPVTQEEVQQKGDDGEEEDGSLHIPARMDRLPSTQDDATFDDLQEQLEIINTIGSPQADPKVLNDFLKEFKYEEEFDDTILASLGLPDLTSSSVPLKPSKIMLEEKHSKVVPDGQISHLEVAGPHGEGTKDREEAEKIKAAKQVVETTDKEATKDGEGADEETEAEAERPSKEVECPDAKKCTEEKEEEQGSPATKKPTPWKPSMWSTPLPGEEKLPDYHEQTPPMREGASTVPIKGPAAISKRKAEPITKKKKPAPKKKKKPASKKKKTPPKQAPKDSETPPGQAKGNAQQTPKADDKDSETPPGQAKGNAQQTPKADDKDSETPPSQAKGNAQQTPKADDQDSETPPGQAKVNDNETPNTDDKEDDNTPSDVKANDKKTPKTDDKEGDTTLRPNANDKEDLDKKPEATVGKRKLNNRKGEPINLESVPKKVPRTTARALPTRRRRIAALDEEASPSKLGSGSQYNPIGQMQMQRDLALLEERPDMLTTAATHANLKEFDTVDKIDYEDFPFIPEEYLFKDVVTLPAYLCEPKEMLGYIVHRRKKMDPNFQWPLPPVNVHEGRPTKREDRTLLERFVTKEEQRAEVVRRRKLRQDYAADKKRITKELRLEMAAMHTAINNHVVGLRQRCIPYNEVKQMPKSGASEDKKADKAITAEYKTFNRETVAEKRAFKKTLDNLPELTRKVLKSQEDNITEVAYIRFRPAVPGVYKDSFDVKKARKANHTGKINLRWIRSWLSVVHYRLALSLPDYWIHVPAGCSRPAGDLADQEVTTCVTVRYPQGDQDLCLVNGLASALHYMGLEHESGRLNNLSKQFLNLPLDRGIELIKKHMQDLVPCIGIAVMFNPPRKFGSRSKKQRRKKITIEQLLVHKTEFPTVVVPLGKDGSVNHAVCIVDDLVFDSTQANALKLCQRSLDWVCGGSGCNDVYVAVRFMRGHHCKTLKRTMVSNF